MVHFLHMLFQLCEFFRTAQFKSALRVATKLKPSLASRFLRRFQECFTEEEFVEHVDKCVFIHECVCTVMHKIFESEQIDTAFLICFFLQIYHAHTIVS